MKNLDNPHHQRNTDGGREAWRVRLGLETGGPGWKVQGPPEPLSAAVELALLAVRQMRSELAADMANLNLEIGKIIGPLDPVATKRGAFRAAISAATTPFELATRQLRRSRRRVA